MRILRFTVVLVTVLSLSALTAVAYAGTSGQSLFFTEHDVKFHVNDIAPPGPSIGDVYVVRGPILADGQRIGAIKAVCTLTGPSGRAMCEIAFRFGPFDPQADRLYLEGLFNPERPSSTFAVIGGAFGYAGASGSGTRTPIDGRNASWEIDLN